AGAMLRASVEASAVDASGSLRTAAAPECYTVSGDTTDPDVDGIPTDAKVTFSNCNVTGSNGSIVLNGYLHLKDGNNAAKSFDFSGDSVMLAVATSSPAGNTASFSRVGVIEASSTNGYE